MTIQSIIVYIYYSIARENKLFYSSLPYFMKLQTIYVGRLDKEKGIKSLLEAFTDLLKNGYDITINIYGAGEYTHHIQQLAQQYPQHIIYHGWQKKNTILTTRKRMDYFIMPSQFLETFGLTACESLLCWVPVIGNKKWWLIPFIDETLNIQSYPGNSDGKKLTQLLTHIIDNKITKTNYTELIQHTQQTYSKETRYGQIKHLLSPEGKVLYISDYINYNGGGIETHIHDNKTILEQQGHTTELYGHQAPTGKFALLIKLAIMAMSIYNIPDAITLHKKTKKNTNWLIRRHSISRVIGWLPVACSDHANQIISHHELGLFHPYPSQTYQLSQIPKAWSLSAFIQAGNTKNPIQIISIMGKYCLIRLLHKQLKKKIKTHIVPSEWMVDMVKQRHPQANVLCIPHFVDIE